MKGSCPSEIAPRIRGSFAPSLGIPPFIGWDIGVGVEIFLGGDGYDVAQTQMRFPPIGTLEKLLGERAYTQQLTGRAHLGLDVAGGSRTEIEVTAKNRGN